MPSIRPAWHTLLVLGVVLCLVTPVSTAAGTRIASWNLKHLGWHNGKDLSAVARIIGRFDLVAIQEVMHPPAARQLAHIVTQQTGDAWGVTTSRLEGQSSYRESYAYLWRRSAVRHDPGNSVYVDPGNRFAREPFTAEFTTRDNHTHLTLGTVHITYGDDRSDRTAEIRTSIITGAGWARPITAGDCSWAISIGRRQIRPA